MNENQKIRELESKLQIATNRATTAETETATIKEKYKDAKIKKEFSDFFLLKSGENQKFDSLSETKRFFETIYPEFVTKISNGEKMKVDVFHKRLAKELGL